MPASETYRCSFDAKVNRQDVRIRTLLVQFENARLHFNQALEIDPKFKKATDGLDALK